MLLLFVAGMSTSASAPARPAWTITNTTTAQHLMAVYVEARPDADLYSMRRAIVREHAGYDEILIYVRTGGPTLRRIQWTPQGGYSELLINTSPRR